MSADSTDDSGGTLSPQAPPRTPAESAVQLELEARRQKLLDLTRRNRLLNFRPTRRTTVTIVDEAPSELFRLLALEGKTLGFLPATEPEAATASVRAVPARTLAPELDPTAGGPTTSASPGKPAGKPGAAPVADAAPAKDASELGIAFAQPRGRCPFCHDAVGTEDPSAVCNACLSRLHAECWDELGRCASCGAGLALISAPTPAAAESSSPAQEPADDGLSYQRVAREELPERHRDLHLQSTLLPADLEKNLLAIHRQAAQTFEEQGFNALFLALGFLEWTEKGSAVRQKAPILLVPVNLKRRSVRSPFKLSAGEDDALVNPALAYKLQQDWGLELPAFEDAEEVDPEEILGGLAERVAEIDGWRVTTEAALALFSFTKFVMYKDLEAHGEAALAHPLLRRLLGASEAPGAAPAANGEPLLVLDADASQRAAVETVLAGNHLVLEGPPGTGKSQTITNLIASFLAAGRSVLFVSEKMAALEVVQSRLEDVGLGAFCLELHSRHANKRAVVQSLARTLELALPQDHAEDRALESLATLETRLDGLVSDLHQPWGALQASPYQVLGAQAEAPPPEATEPEGYLRSLIDSGDWSHSDLEEREHALTTFSKHAAEQGSPRSHPCRGVGLGTLSHSARADMTAALDDLLDRALPAARAACQELASEGSGRAPQTPGEALHLLDWVELLLDPACPAATVLRNPAWDGESARARELIELSERHATLRGRLDGRLVADLPARDELIDLVSAVEGTFSRWYRFLLPRFWSARSRVRELLVPDHDPDPTILLRDLTFAAQASDLARRLRDAEDDGRALFGPAWPGDRAQLERTGELARRFRRCMGLGQIQMTCLERIADDDLDPSRLRPLRDAVVARREELVSAWERFVECAHYSVLEGLGQPLRETPWDLFEDCLRELRGNVDRLEDWIELRRSQRVCEELGLGPFLEQALDRYLEPEHLTGVFRQAFLMRWLDAALEARPDLGAFDRIKHQGDLDEFRRLDARRLQLARVRLRHQLASRRPDASWDASESSELGLLQRELRRKRGHLPVRQLLRRIPKAVMALKPCLLMSPLSVAQFTEPGLHTFDVVVFDEASQIAPEDALGAILRGRQAVIVGDSKQMPPTSFFKATASEEALEADASPDMESILDEGVARGLSRRVLRWHYRSRHESLIAFSNHHFYERRLRTFPSPDDGRGRLGLRVVHVDGAVYERGRSGRNELETEAVADAVIAHYQRTPGRSLGVGTFSQAQQEAILDAVEQRLRRYPDLEPLLASSEEEHFFVKNLENLQGDERDVIFVSIGYGPDAEGKLRLNFGPLNQVGGERRLNVLVTRAREQLVLFSSIRADQIDLSRTQSRGVHLLRAYLEFAERGQLPAPPAEPSAGLERFSLVQDIERVLRAEGLDVEGDLGTSGVRVDLAIREEGRFVLGILLDGARYAALETAGDRDRIVPTVLSGLGWRIARVWSMDWYRRRQRVLEGILAALAEARTEAAAEAEAAEAATVAQERALEAIALKPNSAPPGDDVVRAYEPLQVEVRGGSSEFHAAPTDELADVFAQVVRAEGPIHEEEAQRRALAHWELSRSGKRARVKIEEAAGGALEKGAIRREGEFFWPADVEQATVRDRSRGGPRDAELIPPQELAAALLLVARKEIRIAREDLLKRAAKLLGFTRAGGKLKRALQEALEALAGSAQLQDEHGIVTVSGGDETA